MGRPMPMNNGFGNATPKAGAGAGSGGSSNFGNPMGQGGSGGSRPPVTQPRGGTGGVCGADVYSGERQRLDIYMMVDDSGSMVPWWPATLEAINMFYRDLGSAGIGVGLQFFGSACEMGHYATPIVPIQELPGHLSSLEAAFPLLPIEGTATLPAMQGAIAHARAWSMEHPDSKTVVLLVTDGLPDDCGSNVENVTAAVREGVTGSPSIQTFVIGLGDLGALNMFAEAGGTGEALVIQPGAAPALVAALNQIRTAALPCSFKLPAAASTAEMQKLVNLQFKDLTGAEMTIGAVDDQGACDATKGGWYYDSPAAPTQLVACEKSCEQLNTGGEVQVTVGCPTIRIVPE
jgi:hypothetical protein